MQTDQEEAQWLDLLKEDGCIAVFHFGGWSGDSWTIHESLWEAIEWAKHSACVVLEEPDDSDDPEEARALLAFDFERDDAGEDLRPADSWRRLDEFLLRMRPLSKGFVFSDCCVACNYDQVLSEPLLLAEWQDWLEDMGMQPRPAAASVQVYEQFLLNRFRQPGAFVHEPSCEACTRAKSSR